MVKQRAIKLKLNAPKHRAHRALFDHELPFQHRVEKSSKSEYRRKPKHRNKGDYDAF